MLTTNAKLPRLSRVFFIVFFALAFCAVSFSSELQKPDLPTDGDKAALLAYQESLAAFGQEQSKTMDEFWAATGEGYYESTKALLALDDLTPDERVEFNLQFAGILANYASYEFSENGRFGSKFEELRLATARSGQVDREEKSETSRQIFLNYAKQLFGVRLKCSLTMPETEREQEFVSLIGDAITFALSVPEFGETANNIVTKIRVYSPELGEEALDALCEAFEASGNPALVKPIQKTLGERRYARLVGTEPYCEALLLSGKDFTEPFDLKAYSGKVVLFEIWATWCGPCRREIPRLKEVYEKYHDAGLEIIGYSIDQDLDALKEYVKDSELPWRIASQKKSEAAGYKPLYEYYSVNGVPEMILIGRDGRVVMVDARGCKLADALKELFPDVEPLGWDPATDFSQRVKR